MACSPRINVSGLPAGYMPKRQSRVHSGIIRTDYQQVKREHHVRQVIPRAVRIMPLSNPHE